MPAAWPTPSQEQPAAIRDDDPVHEDRRAKPVVLVVDDSEGNRDLIEACLADIDCGVRMAEDGITALRMIAADPPALVLLDVQMPGIDGYEVCRRIKAMPEGRLTPVVMVTGLNQTEDRVMALQAGADDVLAKPVERAELEARVRSGLRLNATYTNLDNAERVIYALAGAVEARGADAEGHANRVADTSCLVGRRMGLPDAALDVLRRGALIHDIGKIAIPDAILLKPGPLSADEILRLEEHPVIGERIVRPLRSASELLPIIRHHHERFDGGGYPDGLAGARIPRLARIVAACDAFDALTTGRPYRPALSAKAALAVLVDGAGIQWDPQVVDALKREIQLTATG
jgi:putative two-component system response regulator